MVGWGILALAAALQSSGTSPEAFKFDYLRVKDRIEADGSLRRVAEVSVLLRTSAAVQEMGQITTPYVDGFGDVTFEQIRVQKPSGVTSEVTDARLEDLNPFGVSDGATPADVRVKRLTIPRLEPGDRLSYRTTSTHRPFVPGDVSGEVRFARVGVEEPQVYELDIPAISRLTVNLSADLGVSWETLPSAKDRLVRRLTVRVPPLVVASTGLTEAQVEQQQRPDVSYTTFATWSKVGQWWWEMSRAQLSGGEVIKEQAMRLVAGKATPREKVEAIAAFVGSNVRYLNVNFGIGRMQPRPVTTVLSGKYGDCKDKTALVLSLAEAVGIEVRPVLIHSTRSNLLDETPGPHQFDHMIAVAILGPAEKDWLWMDPTNSLSLPTTLSLGLRDKRALVVDRRGEGRLVQTPPGVPASARMTIELTGALDAGGLLKGRAKVTNRSDTEALLRSWFGAAPPEQHSELVKAWLGRTWKAARIDKVRISDLISVNAPFGIEFDFERDVAGIDSQNEWKFWIPDLGPVILEASDDTTAKKPVQFGLVESSYQASVELPEGVTARAPLSVSLDRPFASLTSRYAVEGRTLKAERVWRFPQSSVTREQVPAYEAFRKAADTDREQEFVIAPLKGVALSAAALQKEGKAAYQKKDYPNAIELLQKAVAADPKVASAHLDLGLALRESRKYPEALAAYTKVIEIDPFHESAYAERAYVHFARGYPDDAEKELLKQIEVAPFKDWSYWRLAQRRDSQRRYLEAGELYSKALAIDGANVSRWLDAGWAYSRAEKPEEAKRAYEKARALGLKAPQRVQAAFGYRMMGDLKTAAALAEEDLAEVSKNVGLISPSNMSTTFLFWVRRLAHAWMLIGEQALDLKDVPKADKFLTAAWELGLQPDAAFSLGRVRQEQGQTSQALELWAAAATLANWDNRPKDFEERVAPLRKGSPVLHDGSQELARLRFIPIPGPSTFDGDAEILILASGGKVTGAVNTSKKNEAELKPALERLIGQPISLSTPDGTPVTVLRTGTLACSQRAGCQFIAKIETAGPVANAREVGNIQIIKMSPADKSTVTAGKEVRLTMTVAYNLVGSAPGTVSLVVNGDDPKESLVRPQPQRKVNAGMGTVDFDVTFTPPKGAQTIRISVPLAPSGRDSTSTVAGAEFRVVP